MIWSFFALIERKVWLIEPLFDINQQNETGHLVQPLPPFTQSAATHTTTTGGYHPHSHQPACIEDGEGGGGAVEENGSSNLMWLLDFKLDFLNEAGGGQQITQQTPEHHNHGKQSRSISSNTCLFKYLLGIK